MGIGTSKWFRDVEGQNISPFWRGLVFSEIWNFNLFSRIVRQGPVKSGQLTGWALPLALAFLVLALVDRVFSRSEYLPLVSLGCTFMSIVVVVPIQREVLKKNDRNKKWVKRNSEFGWQAVAAMLLWAPLVSLSVIGLFS